MDRSLAETFSLWRHSNKLVSLLNSMFIYNIIFSIANWVLQLCSFLYSAAFIILFFYALSNFPIDPNNYKPCPHNFVLK